MRCGSSIRSSPPAWTLPCSRPCTPTTPSSSRGGQGTNKRPFDAYHEQVNTGADVWYDTISMFYKLQNLLTRFVTHPRWRESVIRALQGNPYDPENGARTREAGRGHAGGVREGSRSAGERSPAVGHGSREGPHADLPDLPGRRRLLGRGRGLRVPSVRRSHRSPEQGPRIVGGRDNVLPSARGTTSTDKLPDVVVVGGTDVADKVRDVLR